MKLTALIFLTLFKLVSSSVQYTKSFLVNNITFSINSFAFDGENLYIPSNNDIVQRSFATGQIIRTFAQSSQVQDLFIFNNTLFTGSSDGMIFQWDLKSGAIINRIDSKCYLFTMELYFNSILVGCLTSSSKMIDFSGKVLGTFDSGMQLYVFQDLIYGFFSPHTKNIVFYDRDLVKSVVYTNAVSVVLRNGNLLYFADNPGYFINEMNLNGEVRRFTGTGHDSIVYALLVLSDFLISGGVDQQIIKWNLTNKNQLTVLPCNFGGVHKILPLNSSFFFSGDTYGAVALCDINTNSMVKVFQGEKVTLTSLALNDEYVIAGSENVEVKQWSVSSKLLLPPLSNNSFSGNDIFIVNNLIISCYDSIVVRNLDTRNIVKEFAVKEVDGSRTFYYADGFVYAANVAYSVHKYNLSSTELVLQFTDSTIHSSASSMIVLNNHLVVVYQQDALIQWNAITGINEFRGAAAFYTLLFPFGLNIVTASGSNLMVISPSTLTQTLLTIAPSYVYAIWHDQSNNVLFVGGNPPILYGLDVNNNYKAVYTFTGHSNYIRNIKIFGDYVYSCGEDGTVKQWSLVTKRIAYSFEDRSQAVAAVLAYDRNLVFGTVGGNIYRFEVDTAVNDNILSRNYGEITDIIQKNGLLFVGSTDQTISIFNSSTLSHSLQFDTYTVPHALVYYNGFLYTGNSDFTIVQWDFHSGASEKIFYGHDAVIKDILIVGSNLFSAGSDSVICKWNLESGKVVLKFTGHTDQVTSLASNENTLFSSSLDKTIIMWDMTTGSTLNVLKRTSYFLGHLGPVNQIVFCNGNLFSASSDLTVKQWDVNKGTVIATMFGHLKPVTSVYCSGNMLFSGSQDFSALQWLPVFNDIAETKEVTFSTKYSVVGPVGLQNAKGSNFPLLIAIPVGIVLVLLVLAVLLFKFLRNPTKKFKNDFSDSTESATSNTQITTTLFTNFQGMAIPGYLELSLSAFRFSKQIAKGGGGTIYEAEIFGKKERVVAKVFDASYSSLSPLMRSAFDQEITLMEFLKSHKNIAKIAAYCRMPCCILMKYYEKGSLKDLMFSKTVITTRKARKYLWDIAEGIKYMHSNFIVHGDLKPENVLVDFDETGLFMVLTDFGIAQILNEKYLASNSFHIANLKGLSVHYAAPEVFRRFRNKTLVNGNLKAGDVYSFAIIVYGMLVRDYPWQQ